MVTRTAQPISAAAAGAIGMRAEHTGLLLGRGADGNAVLLRMFRPQPTRIALIGGLWLARVAVFRALALGAQVFVRTSDERRWHGLGEVAVGNPDRVRVVTGGRPAVAAWVGEPVLHVHDMEAQRVADLRPGEAWQTTLAISAQLTDTAADALAVADAALVQRMWAQQAVYVAARLGVDPDAASEVESLPDDTVALLSDGQCRLAWISATEIEQQMFGPPGRL
ncbi:hypothetical protein [Asanoa iriomotensis]|uniref:Uncharacterized protein n=1 Tax=Asanoa iriomotensis TaxID=234613 RepID=A0ABQ4C9R3_9ACTN|nr:hypothetical protein [Asanoa iriomotensis]GIF59035.1 hypothetical protein Air01nite_51300 [Asanoa iriomotensis]